MSTILLCGGGGFIPTELIWMVIGGLLTVFIIWLVLTVKAAKYFNRRHTVELSTGKKVFCLSVAALNCALLFFLVASGIS